MAPLLDGVALAGESAALSPLSADDGGRFTNDHAKFERANARRQKIESLRDYEAMDLEGLVREAINQHFTEGNSSMVKRFHNFTSKHKTQGSFEDFKIGLRHLNIELPDEAAKRLFDHYDANGNGRLDFDEFKKNVMRDAPISDIIDMGEYYGSGRTKGVVREKVSQAANVRDRHWDDLVDLDALELEEVVSKHIYEHFRDGNDTLLRQWHTFTSGHKNEATYDDFRIGLRVLGLDLPDTCVRRLFTKYDADGSGKLSFSEFKKQVVHADIAQKGVIDVWLSGASNRARTPATEQTRRVIPLQPVQRPEERRLVSFEGKKEHPAPHRPVAQGPAGEERKAPPRKTTASPSSVTAAFTDERDEVTATKSAPKASTNRSTLRSELKRCWRKLDRELHHLDHRSNAIIDLRSFCRVVKNVIGGTRTWRENHDAQALDAEILALARSLGIETHRSVRHSRLVEAFFPPRHAAGRIAEKKLYPSSTSGKAAYLRARTGVGGHGRSMSPAETPMRSFIRQQRHSPTPPVASMTRSRPHTVGPSSRRRRYVSSTGSARNSKASTTTFTEGIRIVRHHRHSIMPTNRRGFVARPPLPLPRPLTAL